MNADYGRNLDLNLLRVFVVVAEAGSVTAAASKLYLTQPAISAALRRLTEAVGAPLFARQGRGVTLTSRGTRLLAEARPHLASLVEAALTPATFDPATSERTMRLGLSDASEGWLLPALLRLLRSEAPRMRLVVVPIQFRTIGEALASGRIDAAITVADDLPKSVRRKPLFQDGFVCLFDPRHVRVGATVTEKEYFAHEHVIVSYAGDLRGIVEDAFRKTRDVRVSVASFSNVGSILEGTALIATVPKRVADHLRRLTPTLATAKAPFAFPWASVELFWPAPTEDDPAGRFLRDAIERVVSSPPSSPSGAGRREPPAEQDVKRRTRGARTRSSRRSASRDRRRGA